MNERHLFRGKRNNGEWATGYLLETYDRITAIVEEAEWCDGREWALDWRMIDDPATIGQCTGLRDSKRTDEYPNGQLIFEGDILRGTWEDENSVGRIVTSSAPCEVSWSDNCACFLIEEYETGFINDIDGGFYKEIEIIGNIHDNPEMVKEANA